MDKELRKLLPSARGESGFVIAVNVDIRGFSAFSQQVESVEAAIYLRSVYTKILDEYFSPSYFKLTGDGMLAVFSYLDNVDLKEQATRVVSAAFRLHDDFKTLTRGDPLVNFPVPEKIGIGIARGAASRIYAGRKTLDYSGRVLNLASRLMALARPSGIVVDGAFDLTLVPKKFADRFSAAEVFLAGVAERTPQAIFVTQEFTTIPYSAKQPIDEPAWQHKDITWTYGAIKKLGKTNYRISLDSRPVDPEKLTVRVYFPKLPAPTVGPPLTRIVGLEDFQYRLEGMQPWVTILLSDVTSMLEKENLRLTSTVLVRVEYPGEPKKLTAPRLPKPRARNKPKSKPAS